MESVTLDRLFDVSVSVTIGFVGDGLFVRLDRRPCEAATSGRNALLAVGIFFPKCCVSSRLKQVPCNQF